MSTDYEFICLDLYQECVEPLDTDSQTKMFAGKEHKAYQHASQWTTIHPDLP
ncbi:hypothetical protein [Desulfosporosinus sp.]|uniref:hypothetical protein n=1 Tax=Desulfosporosinus sp. TaxID=157907 RepID=UPI002310CB27|nr:hypothetical protein [Desulfosporosinus sp.]MDA8220165.1 hypothetical protein [Desulfitobacterium hafniense]